ncbi:MAG: hypothetical protein GX762_07640 [Bacteroidales bacterium]|nr:hypothetical protein [Bacteroidales bacterium]
MKKVILCVFILLLSTTSTIFSQEKNETVESILEKAMKAAESYAEAVEEYDAEVYMRVYVETLKKNWLYRYTHLIPNFVMHNRNGDEGVIEVLSDLRFTYPNNYTADIKNLSGTFTQKNITELLPTNLINLNVYSEMSCNELFFMPLRETSKKYYRYELKRTFTQNGTTFCTISFTPIYKSPKLLEGTFVIEKDTWRVTQFVSEGIDLASEFSIELNMGNTVSTKMLPINAVIHQKFSYLGNVVTNRNLVNINYKLIKLNPKREKEKNLNVSNFFKVRLDSVPIQNNSLFWEKSRKIPLQTKEKELLDEFYLEQLREKQKEAAKMGKDSLDDNKNNTMEWAKTMVMDSRYKYKATSITYGGIFNPALFGYSSFDGLTYGQEVKVNYELKRQSSLEFNAFVGYMFKRKELFTDISAAWNYNPTHLGRLSISVGNDNKTYSSIFLQEIQDSLVNNGLNIKDLAFDYYKNYYLRIYNTVEVANGFSIGTGLDYHIRDATDNKVDESAIISSISMDNTPPNGNGTEGITKLFKRRKTFAPVLTLTWTPEQYYRFERRQKIYVRSRFPTMKVEFSKGLKGVLGSASEYNRFEFDISQNIQLDLMKSFQYHIGMGFFSNQKSEYFTDFEYFAKRNFPDTWDDGIGGVFNLLDRQFYNASDTYIQNHFMYESPFLILNLVPVLAKGVVTERLYMSHLYNPYIRSYAEFGYGIGNNFLNAAVFGSFHKLKFHEVGFKVSLNVFKK